MDERTLRILEFDKIISRLCEYTVTEPAKEIAATLLPSIDKKEIEDRLKETDAATAFLLQRGTPSFTGINDIRPVIGRMERKADLDTSELLSLAGFLGACRRIRDFSAGADSAKDEKKGSEQILYIINSITPHKKLEDEIRYCISVDGEISDSASPRLSKLRRNIKDAQNSIREKLNETIRSSKYAKFVQDSLITMRGERYVIPVKQEHRNDMPGLLHDVSSSGATVFIEPMAVVEANNTIKMLHSEEHEEIMIILHDLSTEAASFADSFKTNLEILTHLDFILAKGKFSLDYRCTSPVLIDDKQIIIIKGRHPLLDKGKAVPINLWIGDTFNSLIITGPNTGGKTVTLKTTGLFVLMAQAGLHLPASEGTKIGVFSNIIADIGDEQSIEQSLSTFSSHMKNIVDITQKADSSTLALLDEIGAGTDPVEGAALAMAILEDLKAKGVLVLATTHYSELKMYAMTTTDVENACCEFDVESLRPTYKLLIGIPGKSNAFAISQKLGLPADILDRAAEFLTGENIRFEDVLSNIEKNRTQTEIEKNEALKLRLETEELQREIKEQKVTLSQEHKNIISKARDEARSILRNAKNDATEIIEGLRKTSEETDLREKEKLILDYRRKLKVKTDDLQDDIDIFQDNQDDSQIAVGYSSFTPGMDVIITNLNKKGILLSMPDKDGMVQVQVGIMKLTVPFKSLKSSKNSNQSGKFNERISQKYSDISAKVLTIKPEIDVRGNTSYEAADIVDKYLDDAFLAGLSEVVIIHGKGTGALRKTIQDLLKKHRYIKSQRAGSSGEGDTGVTVATLM